MDEYIFEKINPAHYPLLQKLYKDAFGLKMSIEAITKRFQTTERGAYVIGYIAIHRASNTPAAYYGVFPHYMLIRNQKIPVAQSGDTMTHPGHQRRGLFIQLAKLTYEACREQHIAIVYGSPNDNSYHGLINKLNWIQIDNIDRLDLKLHFKTFPFPKLAKRIGCWNAYRQFARFILRNITTSGIQTFHNTLQPSYGRVCRDNAFINYVADQNKLFIEVDGILFWIKLTDVIWVGDISNYEMVTPAVLKKLRRVAFWLGYNTIRFSINESIPVPMFMKTLKKDGADSACFLFFDKTYASDNFILTGCDFDTW